ncbi:MAG: hypothetical protein LBF97_03625 [Elusimicrobiota bacterium]|nr:hypothetical protein [Elusimicrobiota bacterium]
MTLKEMILNHAGIIKETSVEDADEISDEDWEEEKKYLDKFNSQSDVIADGKRHLEELKKKSYAMKKGKNTYTPKTTSKKIAIKKDHTKATNPNLPHVSRKAELQFNALFKEEVDYYLNLLDEGILTFKTPTHMAGQEIRPIVEKAIKEGKKVSIKDIGVSKNKSKEFRPIFKVIIDDKEYYSASTFLKSHFMSLLHNKSKHNISQTKRLVS